MHDTLAGREAARTIFIVRHGKTKLNNQTDLSVDRERGWSNVPLTDEGRREAKAAALKLKTKGIEAIASSDLERAKETAQIIGRILGIKPEFSNKLRPWNLGDLTGKPMDQANPCIAAYAKKPDETVPGGESFNTFKRRAFEGLAECASAHGDETLLIVCHHRVERLIEAWNKAGQPADHAIDLATFMSDGEPPGGIEELETTAAALKGDGDMRGMPQNMRQPAPNMQDELFNQSPGATPAGPNPMAMSGMPAAPSAPMVPPVGPSPRKRFDEAIEKARKAPGAPDAVGTVAQPRGGTTHLAHGRAIAGAKALHAVGSITPQERDRHIARSQAAIGKKPFGSFAP